MVGQVNGALEFDGVDDELVVADADHLDWQNGDSFTIESWVKTTTSCSSSLTFMGKYRSSFGQGDWWFGCDAGDVPYFGLRDSDNQEYWVAGSTAINDGVWHHVVAVRDAGSGQNRLYVDGVEEGVVPTAYTGDFGSDRSLSIGALDDQYRMQGALDEIRYSVVCCCIVRFSNIMWPVV